MPERALRVCILTDTDNHKLGFTECRTICLVPFHRHLSGASMARTTKQRPCGPQTTNVSDYNILSPLPGAAQQPYRLTCRGIAWELSLTRSTSKIWKHWKAFSVSLHCSAYYFWLNSLFRAYKYSTGTHSENAHRWMCLNGNLWNVSLHLCPLLCFLAEHEIHFSHIVLSKTIK